MKRILLLGGGHAHLHVLRELARRPIASAAVALVSPHPHQIYSGMVPGVVAGHYRVEQASIALAPLAAAAGVQWLETAAVGIDAGRRLVRLADGRSVAYDMLSLDVGSVSDRDRLPGAREHAIFVRPIERFLRQVEGLLELAARRELDVVVIGGGAAGVELALALEHRLSGRGEQLARIALVVGGLRPLPGYPDKVAEHAERALARRRVTLFRDTAVAVERGTVVLAGGARLACDVPVVATGPDAPAWLAGSGLALDGRGFVVTGPTLQSGSHAEVFAVGDVATRIDEPRPRSGVYAVRAGPALLANLHAFAAGAPLAKQVPQRRSLNLISCGSRRAIANRGRWTEQGRWLWWLKDHIDRSFVGRYAGAASTAAPGHAEQAVNVQPAPAAIRSDGTR